MKTSVVSIEYKQLQEEIVNLQNQWKNSLDADSVKINADKAAIEAGVPYATMTDFSINFPLFQQWVDELSQLLTENNPELKESFLKISKIVDPALAYRWLDEAISFNQPYFIAFANEHQVDEWLPAFIAETVFRPYLYLLSEKLQNKLTNVVAGCGCPVCGEPVRLGQLEGQGQKVLYCPRCSANWLDKKLSCAHCGNEDYNTMKYLTVEGESTLQIHVCEKCSGYTKIIDTRQYIDKPSPQLLDLNTIHLDYIAQENGYRAVGIKKE